MNVLRVKRVLYYQRNAFSALEVYMSHNWDVIIQNMHSSLLSRWHFVCTFGHNLQIIGRILAFYITNDLATIGYIAFRLRSCMQASTGEVRLQTRIAIAFSSDFYALLSNYKAYTSVLRYKRLPFCNGHSFSTLEPHTRSE